MKNYPVYILSVTLLVAIAFGFSSCKDDEPATPPKLSFSSSTMSVSEADGVIDVELVLDKAYGKDLTIEYTLGGTASDQDAVGTANADYEVVGEHGVVVIESGQTSGIIKLEIYNDALFEPDETIEISILDVNTSDVELTADDEIEITITNDDAQITASFASTAMTVSEADGFDAVNGVNKVIKVTVQLDQSAPTNVTIDYSVKIDLQDGSRSDAIDTVYGRQNQIHPSYFDYYFKTPRGQVTIPTGATSGDIEIQLYTDFMFEDDEIIELTLTGSNIAQLGTNKTMIITIEEQDGKVIALLWDPSYTDVDMDMFLWIGEDTTALDGVLASALTPRFTPQQEIIFVPALLADGAFGLSYTYYEGTEDPMNFEVQFADFTAGVLEAQADRDLFAASYTLANINPWDTNSGTDPVIVHRFVINAGTYSYGKIQVPTSGSRMRAWRIPPGLRRAPIAPSVRLY